MTRNLTGEPNDSWERGGARLAIKVSEPQLHQAEWAAKGVQIVIAEGEGLVTR